MNRPNFRDETRLERSINKMNKRIELPISFCIPNLINDNNYALIVRTALGYNFKAAYCIGTFDTEKELKRFSCQTYQFLKIQKFSNPVEYLNYSEDNNIYNVAIDLTDKSKDIENINIIDILKKYKEIVVCLGHESLGIPAEILFKANEHRHIKMPGPIGSLNVGAASAIVFYTLNKLITGNI